MSLLTGEAVVRSIAYGGQRVPAYNLSIPNSPTYYVGKHGLWVHNCGFRQLFNIKYEHFMHRKGWDIILGKNNPTKDEIAEVLELVVSSYQGELKPNGVTKIVGHAYGHQIYVHIFARDNGLYEITTAGLRK